MCYVGVTNPEGEGELLRENVSNKPNTPNDCESDWSMQQTLDFKR